MSDYKVVYRQTITDEGMTWEPGCPLVINTIQVARNTITAVCFLQLKFINVSNQLIESLEGTANIVYADNTSEDVEFAFLDADIKPKGYYQPPALLLKGSKPISVHVAVKRIKTLNTSWESSGVIQEFPSPSNFNPLELSTAALTERNKQLEELQKSPSTLAYAAQDHDSWWICSCGAVNVGREKCRSCWTYKDKIFQLQDEAKLEQAAQEREAADLKRKQQNKKLIRISVVALVALLVIAAGVGFYFYQEPVTKYLAATSLKENGEYAAAYEVFNELDGFIDSDKQVSECRISALNTNPVLLETLTGVGLNSNTFSTADILSELSSDDGDFINIRSYDLQHGYVSITLNSEEELLDKYLGYYFPSTDHLFVAQINGFGGIWNADISEDGANLILTNVENPNVWISFPFESDSE